MREPPPGVADDDVLGQVRRSWDGRVDRVAYAPVGFGAHHWTAYDGDGPLLFVTYDTKPDQEGLVDLEGAYSGAVALADRGLEFVLAPLTAHEGRPLVPFAGGALSATPWRDGTSEAPLDLSWTQEVLRRLHATDPPAGLPRWRPKVDADFAEAVTALTDREWGPGPYAADARSAVQAGLADIGRWTLRYHHLADVARTHQWVAAHGEPHAANQLMTSEGRLLVDWDTLRVAPPEVDLRVLVEEGARPTDVGADPEMLELFDLEWRLDEISQYTAWFAAPHTGTRDDEIAIGGLRDELARPEPQW